MSAQRVPLVLAPAVESALHAGRAVVALESTVISHGLPWPQNLELAQTVERIVREAGATPATVALLDGAVRVGLDDAALERLATAPDVVKVSLRDIAPTLVRRHPGGTTVAGTMWAAHQVGIRVFATGGIGGVHRGDGGDVSADLPALATIPVAVISSGAKAILDLSRTREWLETWGVPVLGWRTDALPAFYSRSSGLPVDHRVESAAEAAEIIALHLNLARSGLLLSVPVPAADEFPAGRLLPLLARAEDEAQAAGIVGAGTTPFLLRRLSELSAGGTLRANLALLQNNARVAAAVAVALANVMPEA
ncbi:MAG: pseudouridine-5'-phosphate glycosidase [Ardenticatenaceae bacterium]|nr:pseudouridine-5'-phosphate glycosidase [Ardenticatenaceae bacterium]